MALEFSQEYPNFDKSLAEAFPTQAEKAKAKREILLSVASLQQLIDNVGSKLKEAHEKHNITEVKTLSEKAKELKDEATKVMENKLRELEAQYKQYIKNN